MSIYFYLSAFQSSPLLIGTSATVRVRFRYVTIHDFQDRFGAALLHPASFKEMAPKSPQLV